MSRRRREPPDDLSLEILVSEADTVVLLSFAPTPHGLLTEAERSVALAITRGLGNAEIARLRRTSPRTIANQVAAIFEKLGVSSRAELAAHYDPLDFL